MTHNSFKLASRPPGPSDAAAELERQITLWRSPWMRELFRSPSKPPALM